MSRFYSPYFSNGKEWKRYASCPPMWYPTHSVSHILSVTFARMTEVCCFGYTDHHVDGIFDKDLSMWGNVFSNQTAIFRTSDGGCARINEFRRTGAGESRMSIIGTKAAYEEQPCPEYFKENKNSLFHDETINGNLRIPVNNAVFSYLKQTKENPRNGVFDYETEYLKEYSTDVSDIHLYPYGVEITEENLGSLPKEYIGKKHLGVCKYHDIERLPKEFVGLKNGHCGSHQFIVLDFIEAIETGKLPPNNVWLSAAFTAPGIVAHESAKQNGKLLKIPHFGTPSANYEYIDKYTKRFNHVTK